VGGGGMGAGYRQIVGLLQLISDISCVCNDTPAARKNKRTHKTLFHYNVAPTLCTRELLTFNSSLRTVVVISAHFPTEHSLFHAHVPLSATEALLS